VPATMRQRATMVLRDPFNSGRHLTDMQVELADFEDVDEAPPAPPESPESPPGEFPPLSANQC
jgi:hypothetical protein